MALTPLRIEEPRPSQPPRGFALFNLGFRPFYLLAALFGAVTIAIWVATMHGLPWPGVLPPILWHQHEMLVGFAFAVIAGFLLTAGRVWTGRSTPEGWPLAGLCAHWIAARIAMAGTSPAVAALIDGSFPFVIAAVMARAIIGAGNRRNYGIVALLLGFAASNAWFHLAPGELPMRATLWLVMTLVVVMAGRVVPSFTANALPKAGVVMRPVLDRTALVATLAAFAADLFALGAFAVAASALAAGLLHAARQWGWRPLATRGRPILWILHLSHAWIPVGFALLALEAAGVAGGAVHLHAFGAGAMGGLIMAMITRTALGHTGRPLAAGSAELAAYLLVHGAATLRVAAAFAPGDAYAALIALSGAAWSAAFLLYAAVYGPRLLRPRLDGKPG